MRKHNQEITFYQVQARYKNWRKLSREHRTWFVYHRCFQPEFTRCIKNPDNLFTASWTCWQLSGENGEMNKRAGKSWLKKCEKLLVKWPLTEGKRVEFRLVKITMTKKTEVIKD